MTSPDLNSAHTSVDQFAVPATIQSTGRHAYTEQPNEKLNYERRQCQFLYLSITLMNLPVPPNSSMYRTMPQHHVYLRVAYPPVPLHSFVHAYEQLVSYDRQ